MTDASGKTVETPGPDDLIEVPLAWLAAHVAQEVARAQAHAFRFVAGWLAEESGNLFAQMYDDDDSAAQLVRSLAAQAREAEGRAFRVQREAERALRRRLSPLGYQAARAAAFRGEFPDPCCLEPHFHGSGGDTHCVSCGKVRVDGTHPIRLVRALADASEAQDQQGEQE